MSIDRIDINSWSSTVFHTVNGPAAFRWLQRFNEVKETL